MPENKFNVGNFVLGLIVGAVVVGVIWFASNPKQSGATPPVQADPCARVRTRYFY